MAAGSFASGVNTAITLLHDIDFIYNTMLISYFSIVWWTVTVACRHPV